MLPINTSFTDDGTMEEEPRGKMIIDTNTNATNLHTLSKVPLKSPNYGMHNPQFPTEKQTQKQQQQFMARTRTCSTTTASVNSQEYSSHTRSGHSNNSRTTQSSITANKIIVSPFSSLATQSIGQGKYQQALEYYQLALQDYTRDPSKTTIVELVNAAATCFNLGALAKKLREYSQGADYFTQAQEIYIQSRTAVETYVRSRGATGPVSPSASSVSSTSASKYSCEVCLLQLIVETLQARAHLHYKYQSQVDDAVECHEQVIELLEESNERNTISIPPEHDIIYQKIHFTILSQHARWQFLATSLQALGKFYMEKGELEEAIVSYQDTLCVLRKINDCEIESTGQRQEEILQILRALSDFYMQNHLESTDVMKLERAAFLQEDLENWEKAMQCWERVLYCQSKDHGEESVEVSITLGQLARVMVLEGNLEGALDLYHATANISLKNSRNFYRTDDPSSESDVIFSIPEEIFSGILDIYHELDRIPDGISWLKGLLSKSERREDQARIQLELGKMYLHQGFIHSASDSLQLSLELFDGEDESAFELLKKVENLGKTGDQEPVDNVTPAVDTDGDHNEGVDCLTAITEDGESAFLTEGTSALASTLGAALSGGDTLLDGDDDDTEDLSLLMADTDHDEGDDDDLLQVNRNSGISPENMEDRRDIIENTPHKMLESTEDEKKENDVVENHSVIESESSYGAAHEVSISNKAEAIDSNELYSKGIDIPDINSASSSLKDRVESMDSVQNDRENAKLDKFETEKNETEGKKTPQPQNPYFHFEESPTRIPDESNAFDDTPTTMNSMNSDNSRTALIKPASKVVADQEPINLPNISSSPKHLVNQKNSRGRKGYTEVNVSGKQLGTTGRSRIVKALSSPFRRSRSKSRSAASNPLVPLDEEKEVRQSMPVEKPQKDIVDEESCCSREAPISYIDLRNTSDDDRSLVSQLTFREYEMLSKRKEKQNENGHWWWGVTSEGLEGWFPSNYVNQAVEAAEGFLSAKAIHDRVKSRPLDFDSEEEDDIDDMDEDFSLLKDSFSKNSKAEEMPEDSVKKLSTKPSEISSQSRKQSFGSSAVKELNESTSESNKSPCIDSQIQDKTTELDHAKKKTGSDDISVGMLLFQLAELYMKKKDSPNAMLHCRQALRIQKTTLNLLEACESLNFMAEVHAREKRFKDALSCNAEALRMKESIFGYFHEEVARTLNHCGHVLARQGKFDLAMDKHKEALRILKECCGENVKNPIVSETLIQIGAVYYKERNSLANIQSRQNDGYTTFIEGGMLEVIGRAHEDRGSYRMAIAFFEEKLQFLNDGENSDDLEDVAETLNSLGMLSCRAGMYLEAIDYYDRALGIQMRLGCSDVQLAMARVLAGSVQYYLGHFNKALKLFQDALGALRQVGLQQETVAATLFHIGIVHAALCNYDYAMSNLHDGLDIQKKILGTGHPATLRTRREIGNLFVASETEIDSAFDEYNDIVEAQKRLHGEKHPYVAETLHSIGCAQAKKGEFTDALRTLEDCYNMRLKFLGMDHPQQATTLHEIAKIQLRRGRVKKAIHIVDAALNIRVESLSEHHIDVAIAMTTKANCLVAKSSFADANKLFMEALTIAKTAVGDKHPSVAWIHVQVGIMHLRKCDFELAISAVKDGISIYRQSVDEDHPGLQEATDELERIERAEMLCV